MKLGIPGYGSIITHPGKEISKATREVHRDTRTGLGWSADGDGQTSCNVILLSWFMSALPLEPFQHVVGRGTVNLRIGQLFSTQDGV